MTAKPQLSNGPGNRAGVPLARAQRLAERANAPRRTRVWPGVLVGVATLGGFAAVGMQSQTATRAAGPAQPIETIVETAATPTADFAALPRLEGAPAPLVAPEVVALAAPTPCILAIEERLGALHAAITADETAKDTLGQLVQATLDCKDAALEIEGSLELTTSGIADLHVAWERDARSLSITVIDGDAPAEALSAFAEDGLPTEFVIR